MGTFEEWMAGASNPSLSRADFIGRMGIERFENESSGTQYGRAGQHSSGSDKTGLGAEDLEPYANFYSQIENAKDSRGNPLYGSDLSGVQASGANQGAVGRFEDVEIDGQLYRRGYDWRQLAQAGPDFARVVNAVPENQRGRTDERYGALMPVGLAEKVEEVQGARNGPGWRDMMSAFSNTIGLAMSLSNVVGAFVSNAAAGSVAASFLPEGGWQSLPSSLAEHAAANGGSFADITNALTGGGGTTGLIGDAAGTASTGAAGAAANTTGLTQMATDAGLTGPAADSFVTNGGLIGTGATTAAAAGGAVASALAGGDADIINAVNQWMDGNGIFNDSFLEGGQFDVPAAQGGSVTPFARDTADPVSDTARRARELLGDQAPAPVSNASLSPAGRGLTNPLPANDGWFGNNPMTRNMLTAGVMALGGAGTAMINRGTMERQAELNREGARDILDTRQRNAAENAFTGTVGIRPGVSAPLQRVSTRAPVYTAGGLINGVRRQA